MSVAFFRRASIYKLSMQLNRTLITELECGLLVQDEEKLRHNGYRFVAHITKSLSSHYPNERLKRLNQAYYHFQEVKRMLPINENNMQYPFEEVMLDLITQLEKLIKVHMKNYGKKVKSTA